jgi:hypothetical protein
MKVRIVNRPTGLLNGRDWPLVGEVLEVEDNVGADMCASGIGEPVVDDKVEKAVPTKKAETRKGGTAQASDASAGSGGVTAPDKE